MTIKSFLQKVVETLPEATGYSLIGSLFLLFGLFGRKILQNSSSSLDKISLTIGSTTLLVLWLATLAIAIFSILAYYFLVRKLKEKIKTKHGILLDKNNNALCPVDKTPMNSRPWKKDVSLMFSCPKCNKQYEVPNSYKDN